MQGWRGRFIWSILYRSFWYAYKERICGSKADVTWYLPLLSAFPQIITLPSKVVASAVFLFSSESYIFLDLDHLTGISNKVKKKINLKKNQYFYCLIPHGILQLCWNKTSPSGWTRLFHSTLSVLSTPAGSCSDPGLPCWQLTEREKRHFKWCLGWWGVWLIKTKNNGKVAPGFITEIKNSTILSPLCRWNSSHTEKLSVME